jgi:hypothetical protein
VHEQLRDRRERSQERVDQSAAAPPCVPGHLPGGTALGAGPRIFLRLPREPHAMIITARWCRVKRLPRFVSRPPDSCRGHAARLSGPGLRPGAGQEKSPGRHSTTSAALIYQHRTSLRDKLIADEISSAPRPDGSDRARRGHTMTSGIMTSTGPRSKTCRYRPPVTAAHQQIPPVMTLMARRAEVAVRCYPADLTALAARVAAVRIGSSWTNADDRSVLDGTAWR